MLLKYFERLDTDSNLDVLPNLYSEFNILFLQHTSIENIAAKCEISNVDIFLHFVLINN